tara:strand:- start:232 stop:399 length:168 start_codon:yes stop_codon:yes gene_type:complete
VDNNYVKERIFYYSVGHNLTDFDTPKMVKIQMRDFRWESEGKYSEHKELISPVYR